MPYIAGSWQDGGLIPDVTKNAALKAYNASVVGALEANKVVTAISSLVVATNQVFIQGTMFVEKGDIILTYGTSTGSNGASTFKDTSKAWTINQYAGKYLRITAGVDTGFVRQIVSNTATQLTIAGTWGITVPDATSKYEVYQAVGGVRETLELTQGTASAGGASTLTDAAKTWTVNAYTGMTVTITGGTGVGQVRTIASNTATALTVTAVWAVNPDATSTYKVTRVVGSAIDDGGPQQQMDMFYSHL